MSEAASAHKPAAHDAESLTKKKNVNDGIATRPKRVVGPPSGPTGDAYIDHGALCDQRAGSGCFLEPDQRARLVTAVQNRITYVRETFRHAAQAVRMDKLLEKDDGDMSWLALFLLDIATGHLSTLVAGSITILKNAATKRIGDVHAHDAMYQVEGDHGWGLALGERLTSVSDAAIKNTTKQVFDAAKKGITNAHKAAGGADARQRKRETVSYLRELMDATARGFMTMSQVLPAIADDATLIAFYDSFDENKHAQSEYEEAIAAKVGRFENSGVLAIGRNDAFRTELGRIVERDVQLVWLIFMSGSPMRLAYQRHDKHKTREFESPAAYGAGKPVTDAPENGFSEAPGTNFLVPDEFVDVALQRHQQVWGDTVHTVLYDDSDPIWGSARVAAANEYKRRRAGNFEPKQPARPFKVPDELKLKPATSAADDKQTEP